MAAVVADTHSLLWYVHRSPKLSPRALEAMEDGATALHMGLRLVSRDHRLKDSPVETIW
jgi:PIN domain nuclease of toxin-antitoxin system